MNCPECVQQFTYIGNDKDLAQQQLEEQLKTHYQQKHKTKPLPTPPPLKSNNNNSPQQPTTQLAHYLPTLQAIRNYFLANNIQTITQDSNGNLTIIFNQTNSPTQTITNEQLTSNNSDMDSEQKTMWQKFKEYLKKKGKSSINKQELEQEISHLTPAQNNQDKGKTDIVSYLIGGGIILVLMIVLVYFLTRNKKKALQGR